METKLKCLVIDDEPIAIGILEDYIDKVPFLEHIGSHRSAVKALGYQQGQPADLIFLDIKMPDLSGIQFLKSLANQPLVIFTTAYSEFAVESYDFQAVDCLLKPIEFDRFLKACNRALQHHDLQKKEKDSTVRSGPIKIHSRDTDTLLLKSGTEFHSIQLNDILYVEGAGNYSIFITSTKKIMVLMNLKEALARLPSDRFFRTHRSYIVNLAQIDKIGKDLIRIGKEDIPIGESYKKDLFEKLEL